MPAAPLPRDEAARRQTLEALNVLDTLPEAFSDAVAGAAALIANVPISAVSLVDRERQWFKGACGLDVAETPRDVSFCAYAIHGAEPLLVPDARLDARFRDNPLVTGSPFLRSYAGFPLIVAGQPVGALCVIDDRPRTYTDAQVTRLQRLAAGTAAWLIDRQSIVSSLSQAREELRQVTFTDAVTGLPNRLVLQDRLKQAVARCDESGRALAVLFVDIDHFKSVNDLWGEDARDGTLREVGRRLASAVRATDTVACVGGDQFLVLVEDVGGAERASHYAERIGEALRQPIGRDDRVTSLTASIGIALYPSDGSSDRLAANADTAMVSAKKSGGNAHRFYEARMDADARARLDLLEALRLAPGRGELRLHYQPKLHARSGQVTGAEALVRWQRPGHGLVGPNVFVPLAEQSSLIDVLGRWVIGEACRQMQAWRASGMHMRVAINLSAQQLRLPTLADEIADALARHRVEPSLLTCEITETAAMGDPAVVLETFNRLKAIGVLISIDDFGTGYSSLSYLRKLPVHQLKIDRSFVTDLAQSEDARSVAKAIVDLAHALRLEVVAEGVETAEQQAILLELGCDKLQGYLFARPMTADAFTAWAQSPDGREQLFRPSIFSDL